MVVINKIDLSTPEALDALVERWQADDSRTRGIVPVSAKENFNVEGLFRTDPRTAARRRTGVLPEGYAHGQDAALLRLGDHPREDPAQLRQGDPLQLRNRDRGATSEEPGIDRIAADDLRGARLAEGHPDRAQGREAQEGRTDRPARSMEEFLRQEGLPATLRQGQRRLAQRRTAIAPVRIRTGIINRTERPLKKQTKIRSD